nr:UvrD-helicase domain-containing protein [Pseudoalteromonas sp. WY3]
MAQYFATPSWLGRFFTRIKLLSIEQESLVIEFKNATKQSFLIKDFNDFSQLQNRIFSAKINLTLGENSAHTTISFLNKAQAKALNIAINQYFSQALEHKINNAKALLKRTALDEYLRDSNTTILSAEVFSLSKRYQQNRNVWQGYLPSNSSQFLSVLASAKNKNDAIAQLRNKYERKQLAQRADFYNNVESNPLTNEQRLAVIRNNDKNLVLAAAGTGKTSVMVAKALDLIATKQAMPEQILVLAYNKTGGARA